MSALGTFAAATVDDNRNYDYKNECCQQYAKTAKNCHPVELVIIGIPAFEQDVPERLGAGNHTFIPVVIGKVTVHVTFLDALAQGIGQNALNSVSGSKLDAALTGAEQYDQAVV